MLKSAYLLAKIGADTAENERNFDNHLPRNWQLPYPSMSWPRWMTSTPSPLLWPERRTTCWPKIHLLAKHAPPSPGFIFEACADCSAFLRADTMELVSIRFEEPKIVQNPGASRMFRRDETKMISGVNSITTSKSDRRPQ